ncbi:uncharacterized protein LOC112181558 [Rosa chinensis]|uniref:uncharacterized protein LOC112181558 n=1 Tax=Rosa chinensis TaxID=74649 RepID=UPI001AD8EF18|nr:uncharacterized protein LOC112181558 [Rosa chinensis]
MRDLSSQRFIFRGFTLRGFLFTQGAAGASNSFSTTLVPLFVGLGCSSLAFISVRVFSSPNTKLQTHNSSQTNLSYSHFKASSFLLQLLVFDFRYIMQLDRYVARSMKVNYVVGSYLDPLTVKAFGAGILIRHMFKDSPYASGSPSKAICIIDHNLLLILFIVEDL